MIDISNYQEMVNTYDGSERKIKIKINQSKYMVKFASPPRELRNTASYVNSQFSEDISCKIFNSVGLPVQETFLAKHTSKVDGKTRIVVVCKDFLKKDEVLVSAGKLGLSNYISKSPITTTIEDVNYVFNKISTIDNSLVKERFWDVFVIDALIGNKDRHLNNWGFIANDENGKILALAPVYDCGSSLTPTLSDEKMKNLLETSSVYNEEYNVASAYSMNGNRIFYHEIFKEPPQELKDAIKRIVPKINMLIINNIIHSTEGISDIRKKYINEAINTRYDRILIPSLNMIKKEELIKIYETPDSIAEHICSSLQNGISLKELQSEADKFIKGHRVERRIIFQRALKLASNNSDIKKIISKQQCNER